MESNEDIKLHDFYRGKTILVTGGAGSIGSQIVRQLIPYEPKLIKVLDQNESGLFHLGQELRSHPNIRYLVGNIRDKERLRRAIKNVDILFHAAALKHVPLCEYNPDEAILTNIMGTQNLIDVAREENIDRFISISTDKAVNPINTMGATKLLSEKLVLSGLIAAQKTKFACVRFGNVLNTNGSVVPLFTSQIKNKGPITLTSREMTRFFMSIQQAVHLVLRATLETNGGEIFILKMPALKIIDLAEVMIENLSRKFGHNLEDIKIEMIGLRPGEKLHESLITDEESCHVIEERDMLILRPGFNMPHVSDSGTLSSPLDRRTYCTNAMKLLNKDEIKEVLLKESLI